MRVLVSSSIVRSTTLTTLAGTPPTALLANPYRLQYHWLWQHGSGWLPKHVVPTDFEGLREYLSKPPAIEGIVWWRDPTDEDCEKVKIKRRDFGLPWPVR